jgi:hypothetical protein
LLFLREDFAIADNAFMQSVVTSATLLGAIFGALLTGPLGSSGAAQNRHRHLNTVCFIRLGCGWRLLTC